MTDTPSNKDASVRSDGDPTYQRLYDGEWVNIVNHDNANEERLARLGPKLADCLRQKYAKALAALRSGEAGAL